MTEGQLFAEAGSALDRILFAHELESRPTLKDLSFPIISV